MVILYFLAIGFKWCAIVCKSSSDVAINRTRALNIHNSSGHKFVNNYRFANSHLHQRTDGYGKFSLIVKINSNFSKLIVHAVRVRYI
jgi:hypothetical protein